MRLFYRLKESPFPRPGNPFQRFHMFAKMFQESFFKPVFAVACIACLSCSSASLTVAVFWPR
jgi:hypothetical protein